MALSPQPAETASQTASRSLLKFLSSEAVVIALATFTAYAVIFSYEAGFCWYYAIPYNLIQLNLTTGLAVAVVLIGVFWSIIYTTVPFGFLWFLKTDEEFRYWGERLALELPTCIAYLYAGFNAIAAVALMIATWYLGKWVRDKVIAIRKISPERQNQTSEEVLSVYLWRHVLPPRLYLLVCVVAFLFLASFAYGRFSASVDPQYTTTVNGRQYMLLQVYGDYIIAAPCELPRGYAMSAAQTAPVVIQPGFRIFKIGELSSPGDFAPRGSHSLKTPRQAAHQGFWGWLRAYGPI